MISRIDVYNRTDFGENRIDPLGIAIYDGWSLEYFMVFDPSTDLDYTIVQDLPGGYLNEIRGWSFSIPNVVGDRVRINPAWSWGPMRNEYLHLAEVEVYEEQGGPTAPVPEPATLLLLGSGLAGLGWFGRKRRKGHDREA